MTRAEAIASSAANPGRAWAAKPASSRPTLAAIEEAACRACGVATSEIRGRDRHHVVCRARQIRAMLARELTHYSYKEIGDAYYSAHSKIFEQHQAALRNRLLPEFACLYERALELCEGLGQGST